MLTSITTDDPAWGECLRTLRHDLYHLPAYCRLEARRRGMSARAFLFRDGERVFFVPYLLRRCDDILAELGPGVFDISSPYGYPGPLISDAARAAAGFVEAAIEAIHAELVDQHIASAYLRLHPILNQGLDAIGRNACIAQHGETVSIDLTLSEAQLWSHTRRGHQSSINRCRRLGVEVEFHPLPGHLASLIDVYRETMNRVAADAGYDFDDAYFAGLAALGPAVEVGIAQVGGQPASACIFFECCGIVQAHLGGTMDAFLEQSPFMLILDEARRRYRARGNQYLHLGSGYKGQTGDAIFRFKSGFSRQRFELSGLCLIGDPALHDRLTLARAQALGVPVDELQRAGFFPAYRAG